MKWRWHPGHSTERVVVSQDVEIKKGRAKKVPMVMKAKIFLTVAKAVDNEGASFAEGFTGHSNWEWKPEEDAISVESGSSADHDSSSSNESPASSADGNSSSSPSSSSSSTSSSGVEVLPKTKAMPGKGTKRPITTPKQSAKKRCPVTTSGWKKCAELHAYTCYKQIPPPPPTPPRSPSPSIVVACTLGLEGPHNGAGREAWPAMALPASLLASADQYSHTHTPSLMPSP